MSNRNLLRRATVVVLAGAAAAACSDNAAKVAGPQLTGSNSIFQNYVALGNSLTAGYQSGGINDSTQRRSYPAMLATQMGTRYAYASIANPGCPPPVNNFLTQSRVTPNGFPASTSSSCYLRAGTAEILNNVAVPGATTFDPDAPGGTAFSNLLTQLILGGETQVQRAREANPTFATLWIGNNDVLNAVGSGLLTPVSGVSPGLTPQAAFQANYDKIVTDLTANNSNLKGVLIGVGLGASLPFLFSAQVLQNPQFVAAMSQAAGKTITVDPTTCTPTSGSFINFQIVSAIKANQHPATIACEKSPNAGYPLLGDIFVIDSGELATVNGYITAVNGYISSKAQSAGFAYANMNPAFDSLRALGQITSTGPNFGAPTAPFGKWFSLDGVHPSTAGYTLITNYLIDAINKKYSTSLTKLPNP